MAKLNDPRLTSNPDHRRQTHCPAPPVAEVETRLHELIAPDTLAPLRLGKHKKSLRKRILSVPVVAALVLSIVYRRIPSLAESLRVLEKEGLLWVEPTKVSRQAFSKRLRVMPSELFAELLQQVIKRIGQQAQARREPLLLSDADPQIRQRFSAVWLADGSTLEALRKHLHSLKETTDPLAGKVMLVLEAYGHQPVDAFYTRDSDADDKTFYPQLLSVLPRGGLVVLDAGWCDFGWYDRFTQEERFFITRPKSNLAYRSVRVLAEGPRFRDEIIQVGLYRSNPCQHPLRLISVLYKGKWFRLITNVLDPQQLPARAVCSLYRRRWRIEDAFLLTKRLLGLAFVWVGDENGVQIQLYATLILYLVLTDLRQQVAEALALPLERISEEMVFRALYHYWSAQQRHEPHHLVSFLVDNAKCLGLVKALRKRDREIAAEDAIAWQEDD